MTEQGADRSEIRRQIEELATLSKELESNAKLQANAPNFVAAEQFKKKVTELTERQSQMMIALVKLHSDPHALTRYQELQQQIEAAQAQVKATRKMDELRAIEAELDKLISAWVHHFQTVVAELMGAPPPDAPVFG